MHPEHLGYFSMSFSMMVVKWKRLLCCLGALLGLHCKLIIHANNWRRALEKE